MNRLEEYSGDVTHNVCAGDLEGSEDIPDALGLGCGKSVWSSAHHTGFANRAQTRALFQLDLRPNEVVALRAFAMRIGSNLGERGRSKRPQFLALDPNEYPEIWETESARHLTSMIEYSTSALGSALSGGATVLRVCGLASDSVIAPAPYEGTSDFRVLPMTLMNVFGVIALMGGKSFAYQDENGGRIVRNVVARRDATSERSSQGWMQELSWHMDGAYRPIGDEVGGSSSCAAAPRWLVFGVINACSAVPMTFAVLGDVLRRLDRPTIAALRAPEFDVWSADSVFSNHVTRNVAVLQGDWNRGFVGRFNQDKTVGRTHAAQNAIAALNEALKDPASVHTIDVNRGDVVVLDNWRTLHRRSQYTPRWDGHDRWFIRVYAAPENPPECVRCSTHARVFK